MSGPGRRVGPHTGWRARVAWSARSGRWTWGRGGGWWGRGGGRGGGGGAAMPCGAGRTDLAGTWRWKAAGPGLEDPPGDTAFFRLKNKRDQLKSK